MCEANPNPNQTIFLLDHYYRGSLSNATFSSGNNSHEPKFALAKYLPSANFWLFYFISAIFLAIFAPKITLIK